MDTGVWPERAQPLRSKSTHPGRPPYLVSARAVSKDGAGGAPTARPSGPLHAISSGRFAGRRARSSARPNCNFGGIRPTARGASQSRIRPRPSSHRMEPPALRPSEQTPAHHGMPARSSARRRLPQTEPSSSWIVTSHFRLPPGGRKACSAAKGNRIARRRGRASPSGLGRLRASHLGRRRPGVPRSRVCNFEQTGEAGAGNCRTDGRVAQSAERVREQHETVVRNHSPAAIPSQADGNEPKRTAGAEMNQPGRCRD
jgi:hypothetical protein